MWNVTALMGEESVQVLKVKQYHPDIVGLTSMLSLCSGTKLIIIIFLKIIYNFLKTKGYISFN